jgi:16S rRNA C967 or C1407 C5-methylase (RsmB/RsmF family)
LGHHLAARLPFALQYLAAALGADKLQQISEALTRPPLATCLRVNTLRTTPEVGA